MSRFGNNPLKGYNFELCQPYFIKKVQDFLAFTHSVKGNSRPYNKKLFLETKMDHLGIINYWNYQSAVGMLFYLQGLIHPTISMVLHQCAQFQNDPKLVHEQEVRKIEKYLSDTVTRKIIYDTNNKNVIKFYVDTDSDVR